MLLKHLFFVSWKFGILSCFFLIVFYLFIYLFLFFYQGHTLPKL